MIVVVVVIVMILVIGIAIVGIAVVGGGRMFIVSSVLLVGRARVRMVIGFVRMLILTVMWMRMVMSWSRMSMTSMWMILSVRMTMTIFGLSLITCIGNLNLIIGIIMAVVITRGYLFCFPLGATVTNALRPLFFLTKLG